MTVETRELPPTQEKSFAQEESEGFAKTIQFIETALAEEAHFRVPKGLSKEPWKWERNVDATLTYLLSPDDISLEDTGRTFGGLSRERVRQIRDKTMEDLSTNCSTGTQAIFPFEELELNKPRPQKTKEVIVFSRDNVESKSPHQINEELLSNLKKAETDEKKQELLNQIPYGLYQRLTKGDTPLLTPVKTLVMETGYHPRRPHDYALFTAAIRTRQVAMGEIQRKTKVGLEEITLTYHFIYTEDQERAKEALLKNEHLKLFFIHPVQQVAGSPQEKLPSTTLIRQKRNFRTIDRFLFEFGVVSRGQPTKNHRTLLLANDDFPVPIYRYDRSYLYPVAGEGELRTFVNKHLLTNSQAFGKLPIS